MPATYFRSNKRKNRRIKRQAKRKSRIPKSMPLQRQTASIIETYEFEDLRPQLTYNFQFNLYQFQRASRLAPLFKFYKAAKVEWTIEPLYNTFQDGTVGNEVTVPYIYTFMNRTGDLVGQNLADVQAMGVRPVKLVATNIKSYRPNWLLSGLTMFSVGSNGSIDASSAQGMKPSYDWLPCPNQNVVNAQLQIAQADGMNPLYPINSSIAANNVPYFGHAVRVDQFVSSGVLQPVARVVCRVHWIFKEPHATFFESPNEGIKTIEPKI